MIKAKTNKKIFAILSAVISAVFAIIVGATYCASTLSLTFGTNQKTTTIYAANNHYHINNDTLINPVLFGSGSHNFEISLEYDVPYGFDVRLMYEMRWGTSGKSTDNVILNFANRDDVVVDNQYIYLASSITDKQGKRNIVTGVDFVNPMDENYQGERLTIMVKEAIVETGLTYNANHPLVSDVTSQAGEMWLKIKQSGSGASAMVYNYRYDWKHGVPFPGDNTAYKKVTEERTVPDTTPAQKYTVVTSASWLGGNRAYAGVGIYVYAGTARTIEVEIKGIWRGESGNVSSSDAISEAGIQFNYSSSFELHSWDNTKLWATMKFKYSIPAGTHCYINILDSLEIIRPSINNPLDYDKYRALCQTITVNGGTPLEYNENSGDLSIRTIESLGTSSVSATKGNYSSANVDVVNTSTFSGGLYQFKNSGAVTQDYSTDVSLINNMSTTKIVKATMSLRYRISNGNASLTETDTSGVTKRVEDIYPISSNATATEIAAAHKNRFNHGSLFYTFSPSTVVKTETATVSIAPYSSINVLDCYIAPADLQTTTLPQYLSSLINNYSANTNYDVWLYWDITIEEVSMSTNTSLQIETRQNGQNVDIYAKNNTNKVATIVSNTLKAQEFVVSYKQAEVAEPYDWVATFWQYYENNGTGNQNTSTTFDASKNLSLRQEIYEDRTISGSPTIDKLNPVELNPGELIKIGTVTLTGTKDLILSGGVTATLTELSASNKVVVSNAGTNQAVLINGSSNSYYVRINGSLAQSNTNERLVPSGSYIYYIGILRPGQKICVDMVSGSGAVEMIAAGDTYSQTTLSLWNDSTITNKFNALFNINKGDIVT